eukprot:gnl/Chilomastix_caulleri/3610.p1 GENE.gnl/Chilomastix_caulleri/3610~~gnl/Chilomastix_caulleri/3610.p1  ORF type:complete len:88 (+),score=16.13 gnl/Chilomastix_caulleri/3610:25-264(+)
MPASVKASTNSLPSVRRPMQLSFVLKVTIPNTDKIFIKLKLRTSTRLYTLSMKDIGLAMKFANNIKKANKGIRVRFFKY